MVCQTHAIEVRGLTKRYGDLVAVDQIDFAVQRGSSFAFLGRNGAGKSTTVACLTTVRGFDEGEATVAGFDVRTQGAKVRQHIGVVFQDSLLDPLLSVEENLKLRASLSCVTRGEVDKRIDDLAALLDFGNFTKQSYGTLSGGQRRRVDIARALLHSPSILFLDEPTTGLDPASRVAVWHAIHDLRESTGLTVFLTTHYMEETEEVDAVCIVEAGQIVAQGKPSQLRSKYSTSVLTVTERDGQVRAIPVPDTETAKRILAEDGDNIVDFEFQHGRMDDVFLNLVGTPLGEDL